MRFIISGMLSLFLLGCSTVETQQPLTQLPVTLGQVGPVATDNVLQYPFTCMTERVGLGEPVIDNQEGRGQPVYGSWWIFDYKKGYSQFCGAPMQVSYYYYDQQGQFNPLPDPAVVPDDVVFIQRNSESVPFIVRHERGVINRFVYGITALTALPVEGVQVDRSLWNKKLVMMFNGGIGIGHLQAGRVSTNMFSPDALNESDLVSLFNPDFLEQGYALISSTGMGSDTTFNLPLLQQTAAMVKKQFVHQYAQPEMTIGLGGSGGSIQQFFNARTMPELLDGVVASHMFPDLLTQINGVGDCELLEYYFDRNHQYSGAAAEFWKDWKNRGRIEGFNAIEGYQSKYSIDGTGVPIMADANPGSSVCVDGWRGITPLIFNPKMFLPFYERHTAWLKDDANVLMETAWTHWDDAAEVYGKDSAGYALRTYDNVGVQYGLKALQQGYISKQTFLDLNARIGGWKPSSEMTYEYAPYYPYGALTIDSVPIGQFISGNIKMRSLGELWGGTQNLLTLLPDSTAPSWVKSWLGRDDQQSVWSQQNTTYIAEQGVAPRVRASAQAIRRAKEKNLVFDGHWNKPAIALLVYLEERLDIHDSRQPFVFRERMKAVGADLQQFNIWGLKPSGESDKDSVQFNRRAFEAVETVSNWLQQQERPAAAVDRCWDEHNQLVAAGESVWKGAENISERNSAKGVCAQQFQIYGNPRVAAGESIKVDQLKCDLKPVSDALKDGTYGDIAFDPTEQVWLSSVFPEGVCAY